MVFCSNCGSQIEDSDKFCGNCGKSIQKPSGESPKDTEPLMSRLKKLSGEAVDLSTSLGSSIKERVQQIDDIPSIDQVSDRVFGEKIDDSIPVNLVSSTKLEEYKRVLSDEGTIVINLGTPWNRILFHNYIHREMRSAAQECFPHCEEVGIHHKVLHLKK